MLLGHLAGISRLTAPVVTLSVKQGFGVTVERARPCLVVTLRLIIECQEEGSRLDGVQGHFV